MLPRNPSRSSPMLTILVSFSLDVTFLVVFQLLLECKFVQCVPWQRAQHRARQWRIWNTWPYEPIRRKYFYIALSCYLRPSLLSDSIINDIFPSYLISLFWIRKYWLLDKYSGLFERVTSGMILLFKYFQPITLQLQKLKRSTII